MAHNGDHDSEHHGEHEYEHEEGHEHEYEDEHDDGDEHNDDHHHHHQHHGLESSNGIAAPRRKKRLRNRPRLAEIDATPFDECSTMHVLVCKGFTGQIFRVQVSAFDTVEESLPLLAEQVSYPFPDFDNIGLYNMTRDFEYQLHETFIETGTQEGDLLFMADGAACHKKE